MKTSGAIALAIHIMTVMAARADTPISATLSITPTSTLPSLSAAFVVTMKNTSNATQRVDSVTAEVSGPNGSFEPMNSAGGTAQGLPNEQASNCADEAHCFDIPALSSRQLYFDFGTCACGNSYLNDPHFLIPGAYSVALTLYVAKPDGSYLLVKTNSATLTVMQPTGIDADAWNWLSRQNGTKQWTSMTWAFVGDSIASELRSRFPSSQYAVWTAALGGKTSEQNVANIDAALTTNPNPAVRDALLWAKGSILAQLNHDAISIDRDLDRALQYADLATKTLTILVDGAISDYRRQSAQDLIAHLTNSKTGATTLRELEAHDPPAPAPVVPNVECVTLGKGNAFTARFGYTNPNDGIKVLQIGNRNQVTPAPRDQGQPHVFKLGVQKNVFVASSPGGDLIWHLDGGKAVATASFPVQCVSAPAP